jgi:ferredoxin-like protein FixX
MTGISAIGQNPYLNRASLELQNNYGSSKVAEDLKAEGKSTSQAKNFSSERAAKRAGVIECETCARRKYKDGSDEQVSFKSAQHVSPEAAGARVRAHEQEHVSNAYDKAKKAGGKVLNASVAIHTAVCPECGRTYVSGGTTTTQIKYPNEDNPYQKNRKNAEGGLLAGSNFDVGV